MSSSSWIGCDLDGTLAHYDGWRGEDHIGAPIPAMVERVKAWRADGIQVRILTARVCVVRGTRANKAHAARARGFIEAWCLEHLGEKLPVTAQKDFQMMELFDDRARQVETNTGRIIGDGEP